MPSPGDHETPNCLREEGLVVPPISRDQSTPSIISSSCVPITLKFIDICYCIKLEPSASSGGLSGILRSRSLAPKEKTILSGVTGMVSPGEMLAVLGPSGSGKSTLLAILAGRLQGRHSGSVLANGRRRTRSIVQRTGFVPQDELLYPHLTVRETLVFSALLRLPKTLMRTEKVAAAQAVMAELGLDNCADTIVGNAFVRGVSGGERKRVSIGQEMLVDPSVLLLDEPTSGLDSTAAHRVVEALGKAAGRGRAVVAAVHQPSSRGYQLFDSVLLLAEGRCVYFGRGRDAMDYFALAGFAPRFHVNPADFMLDLANDKPRFAQTDYQGDGEKPNVKQSLFSSYNNILAPKVKACINANVAAETLQNGTAKSSEKERKDLSNISWFTQFTILLHRSLKERRHETFNSLRVFQVIAAAILAGSMWWQSNIHNVQDRLGLLFFISIFWGVFASFNAVFTFPQDRAIFINERLSGMYSLSSYFVARMAGDLPMELILPTIFTIILYWMAGLRPELGAFVVTLAVLLGYVLVAQGLGLALGATVKDVKQASTIVTVTMLAFLLTGGFYVQNVPACVAWMKYTSFTFYTYRLLIDVQYKGREMDAFMGVSHHRGGEGMVEGEVDKQVSAMVNVAALAAMFVTYRLFAYVALRRIKL